MAWEVRTVSPQSTVESMTERVREFVEARRWQQYHRPVALALSVAIETGELLELFQWRTDGQVLEALRSEAFRSALADEIADVFIYLLRLCDVTNIDLAEAFESKMRRNEAKYPAPEWAGVAPNKHRDD